MVSYACCNNVNYIWTSAFNRGYRSNTCLGKALGKAGEMVGILSNDYRYYRLYTRYLEMVNTKRTDVDYRWSSIDDRIFCLQSPQWANIWKN